MEANKKDKKIIKKYTSFNFIDNMVPIIDLLRPIKETWNKKYSNRDFLICLIDFATTNVSWKHYKGTLDIKINGKYLNQIHNDFIKKSIYTAINKATLQKYIDSHRENLKYQIIDSSFIANKEGSIKNNNHLLNTQAINKNALIKKENNLIDEYNNSIKKENQIIKKYNKNNKHKRNKKKYKNKKHIETFIDFNKYNGRKKYFKISTITDSFGVPLTNVLISSKQSDSISLKETINSIPIDLKTKENFHHNRYKQYLIADAGYCSNDNNIFLHNKKYIPVIKYNKKNCKNKQKIKNNTLRGNIKKIYKKRKIIESYFSWIKRIPIINQNYQKTLSSYNGLLLLVSSIFISKKI